MTYYFYKDTCYEEKPRGFHIAKYVTDKKTGDCYAVLKRKGVPIFVWFIFLCSLVLWVSVERMVVKQEPLEVIIPSEVSSFVSDRVYLGLCVRGEPEIMLQLRLYGEDNRCLLQGQSFAVGQAVGNVTLQERLYPGAEIFRLELWQEETGKLILEKTITIVYRKEEIP